METLKKVTGVDFFFGPLETFVHQPNISEISTIGEGLFFRAIELFSGSEKDFFIKKRLESVEEEERGALEAELGFIIQDDLDVFCQYAMDELNQRIVETLFVLIFPSFRGMNWEKVNDTKMFISAKFQIDLTNEEKIDIINKNSGLGEEELRILISNKSIKVYHFSPTLFLEIKELINFLFSYESSEEKDNEIKPLGAMAERIAEKMRKAAERRNRIYGNNEEKGPDSIISTMVSVLATSDKMSINEVLKLTFPQVLIQLSRTQLLRQYETQITLGAFGGLDADDIADWQKPV